MSQAESLLAPFDYEAVITDNGYDSDPLRGLLAAQQVEVVFAFRASGVGHGTMVESASENPPSSNVSSPDSSGIDAFSLPTKSSHDVSWLSCVLLLN